MSSRFDFLALLYMALWFTLSCSIAILNKYIFSTLGFTFPILLTTYHMFGQTLLAQILLQYIPLPEKVILSRERYVKSVLPVAVLLAAEIAFNNLGLRYIPVSFVQTVRSLTPLCAAIVSAIALRKILTTKAALTLIPVCFGVCLSTYEELSFHAGGFCATIFSCFLTAAKLALASTLMGDSLRLDPVTALRLMSPVGAVMLAPFAAVIEGKGFMLWKQDRPLLSADCLTILLSPCCALALNLSIFFLLRRTNAVAVAVAGNLKVAATVVISVLIFRNPVTHLGAIGCAIALSGCTTYGLVKDKFKEVK
jgi:solute carrier family 35, member E3